MMKDIILIVGGTKGGSDSVKYFSEKKDLNIVVADLEKPDMDVDYIPIDVCDVNQVKSMADYIKSKYGSLDHMVNFVGGALQGEIREDNDELIKFGNMDYSVIHDSVQLNLISQLYVANSVTNLMKASKSDNKSMTFISSVNATAGRWELPVYSSAKAGLLNLTKTLSSELGEYGIRVNCVAPGTVPSERTIAQGKDFSLLRNTTTLGRFAKPREVSKAIYALTYDLTGTVGEVIGVDCGQNAKGVVYITDDPFSKGV